MKTEIKHSNQMQTSHAEYDFINKRTDRLSTTVKNLINDNKRSCLLVYASLDD